MKFRTVSTVITLVILVVLYVVTQDAGNTDTVPQPAPQSDVSLQPLKIN